MKKLKWGIVSTGSIARTLANAIKQSNTGELWAVASRKQSDADAFGETFSVPKCYANYQNLIEDPEIDAVYIATPHPMHAQWAIKSAEAKKHILLEKPLTLNYAEAMAVIESARKNDVFLMEAFAYRCHPQTAKLVELIQNKVIGDVRFIQAVMSIKFNISDEHRLIANDLGGGGILDMGCYTLSIARLIAGTTLGKAFIDPVELKAVGSLNQTTHTDMVSTASLRFENGVLAQLTCGVNVNQDRYVRIFGSNGVIYLPTPWGPGINRQTSQIIIQKEGATSEAITFQTTHELYSMQVDSVAQYLSARQHPSMTWDDSLGIMRGLDQWREQIGLVYDREKPNAAEMKYTVSNRTLKLPTHTNMPHRALSKIDKPISRLVMGVDNQRTIGHASVMFDDFVERGGNTFDTAHIYGGGQCERIFGAWLKNRNIRESVVIVGKGAHTPFCNPKDLTQQLNISLDRMGVDYVDIYMMHRDNTDVPVGEFINLLNEHLNAGRCRLFGASNWSLERVKAGNDYARTHGLSGFSVVSNNFSLARMIEPPWAGCRAASELEWREWLTETQTPILSWSSQARGFFLDHVNPAFKADSELVRCWYSDDNFERQKRARALAEKYNVPTIAIALAYVLHQPFPTFALIGPRQLSETRTSCEALGVRLSSDEVAWLNLA
jgi:predicted dehydrogenase/aryl-alcohol dehydrogenase-like predicted oxidoreductase